MKQELIDKLHGKYPLLFRKKNIPFIADGWFSLLYDACNIIEHHIKTLPEELQDQIFIETVKEKFGELRIYLSQDTPYIEGIIDFSEVYSRNVCEICGNKGSIRNFFGWYRALCDEDLEKETKSRAEKRK